MSTLAGRRLQRADPPSSQESDPRPAPEPPKEEDNFIVGKRTTEIVNAEPELKKGAEVGSTRIVAKDPITLVGNAYVSSHRAPRHRTDRSRDGPVQDGEQHYPKDFAEFQSGILKPNNIALPQLPYYQKYGYDEKEHKLIILEYPDLKNQVPR